MMAVVNLGDKIRNRQLQLMRPQSAGLLFRREAQARTEKNQNVCGLSDDQLTGFQKRRRERWSLYRWAFHNARHRRHPTGLAGDFYVVRSGVFQSEPNEFSASLYARPIIQFVAHRKLSETFHLTLTIPSTQDNP
jgi:hypothetical protein